MLEQQFPLPDLNDSRPLNAEEIETLASRRARYRQQLVRRQTGRSFRLKHFLLYKRDYFRTLDMEARRKYLEQVDIIFRYFDGDMYGSYDELGRYTDQKRKGDFAYALPLLTGHVGQAFMQWLKTKPIYLMAAKNKNDDDSRRLATMCEEVALEDFDRIMQEDERHREALNAILAGDSHREIYWSPHPKSPRIETRINYRTETIELPGRRECEACKQDVPGGAPACLACGATFITEIPPAQATRQVEDGEIEVPMGENCLHIPHVTGMQSDLSALRFEDSTYVIEHDFLERHVASSRHETIIGDSEAGLSPEMQARHRLERSGIQMDATVGSARASNSAAGTRKVERERHFLDVSEYGQFYCEVEEQLPDGTKIPAGTILGDFWPDGLFILYLGDEILEVRPIKKGRRWVKVTYGKRPGSSIGQGSKIAVVLNDICNDDFNLNQGVKHTSARPFTATLGQSVKRLPGPAQFLRIDKLPAGVRDIRQALVQYPGQAIAGMDATNQQIQGAMQFILGTNTVGGGGLGGAPDMRAAGTATGIAAMQEQAAGRQIGPIEQRIAADKETLFIILENRRDHSSPEQRKELAKRFGPDIAKIFFGPDGTKGKGANFRQLLTISVKPNSDIPRSMALQQAGQIAFQQAAAGLVQYLPQAPWLLEFLGSMADSFGVSVNIGPGRTDRREAEYRLNMLDVIESETLRQRPDLVSNQQLLARAMYAALAEACAPLIHQPPPAPTGNPSIDEAAAQAAQSRDVPRKFLQDHETFKDVYKDYIFGEESKAVSPARKLVVLRLWQDHFEAALSRDGEMAQLQKTMQEMLNPPPPGPDPAQEQSLRDEETQKQLLGAAIEHQAGEEAKDNDARRKMELAEHAADVELSKDAVRSEMAPEGQAK